ncbi:MAG: hypothetical protein LBU65_09475 [Planctomycetaceae bacterium]|jgi:hypothetical protein|nr:hypothetical protein [Planctomycetaceae bacterium]
MTPPIDVYKQWLGITETNRPLSHYQLLKITQFEDNTNVIRKAYRQLNAEIRKYASGEYIVESQTLLNELAKAMLCLTDAARKLEYDVSLGRKVQTARARKSLEEILLVNNIVPADRMKQVKSYADGVGIDLHEAVLQQKISQPEIIMLAYAESIGLPFISLDDVGVEEEYAPQINPNTARQHSFVPVAADHGVLILASPRPVSPDVEEELRMLFEMPVRSAICTQAQVNAAIAKYYPKDAVQLVAKGKGQAAVAATSSSSPSSSSQPTRNYQPATAEEKKQRIMTVLAATGFAVMLVGVGMAQTKYGLKNPTIVTLLSVVAGAVSGGITWLLTGRR